ncbi:MAG TPA: hypothetical protein ENK91_02295, partial [Bacteroidetes bacterium]|nr:hypothetical protein [Bacteroidota bacterium]
MKRFYYILTFILFSALTNSVYSQCEISYDQNVIINEIGSFVRQDGNGKHTNSEYIELLVIGNPDRPFSPVILVGIVIDDNDVDDIEIGTEYGYIKLADNFPMIMPGTIILIYDDNGFTIENSEDGMPNSNGIYQIPISSSLIEKYDWTGDQQKVTTSKWDDLLPFRNKGDVAQIISSDGKVIHSLSWNEIAKELPRPAGSFYFEHTWLSNKSIQLMNGDYTNIAPYRVSGYSSPGEPNSTENENFINNLKNGVINKFGDFEIRVIKNQTEGNTDAEIEVELTGDLDPEKKWEIYVDDEKIDNPNKDNPLIISNLSGGKKIVRVEIWNKELNQFCPFEKTIEIPVDKTEEEEICKGECITLISEGENCIAWVDEEGNLLSNDQQYEVCPEKNTVITELIENTKGLVIKKIIHHINVKSGNYSLYTEIPDCPAYEVILMVNGQNIDITWFDGTNEPKKTVTSSGEYTVSITDNDN